MSAAMPLKSLIEEEENL